MSSRRLDELFAAFQRDGDPQQLAAVFDGTAAELLRVAVHLAGDVHAAEDLVQGTFLKAIERRDRYDPALPVLPWLLGILANTARHERRQLRTQQRCEPQPRAIGSEMAPVPELAADAERATRLHAALRGLPEPYRQVLLLQVEHGLDSAAIAEITGRKASTVRTQIARGMDLLRAALPVAVGVSVAARARASSAVGLDRVRGEVLQQCAAIVDKGAPFGAVIGGVAMKKMLAAIACLLLLCVGWWWWPHDAPHAGAPSAAAPVATAPDGERAASAQPPVAAADATGALRRDEAVATTGALRVHVRNADGSAAAGIGVYLASERLRPFGREGATNTGGVVQFDDVPLGALLVKPDRGAAQPFAVVAGANEIDVRLPDGVDVEGRVDDPSGKVAIPHATIFLLSREHHDHAQRIAQADENGVFSARALPVGARLFARAAGWQPSDPKRDSVAAIGKGTQRVDLRVGARAHSLRGRVSRPDGSAVSFAQVAIAVDEDADKLPGGLRDRRSGMGRQRDVDAFLLRADADGNYTTDEVPEGEALVVVRPAAGEPPGVVLVATMVAAGADNRCDVVLHPGAELFGTVRDDAGKPFAGLPLVVEWKGTDRVRFEGAFDHLLACVTVNTDADGNYRLPALLAGEHDVRPQARLDAAVRIEQHGEQCERVTLLAAESRRLDLVVPRRGDLAIRLVGPDGAPVTGFGLWVEAKRRPTPRMSQLEAQRTDSDGRTRIRGLPRGEALCISAFGPRPKEAGDRLVDRFPAQQWFDVQVQDDVLALQLDALPAAVLTGRFVDRDGARIAVDSCELRRESWDEVRRFAAKDGVFAHDSLPAGRYWLLPGLDGRPHLGPFDVGSGQRRDLGDVVVHLPGTLRVLLRATDGGAITRPRGYLVALGPGERTTTLDVRDGALISPRRPAGRYRLWISGDDIAPSAHDVELRIGEETLVRVDASRGFLQRFEVVTNGPVAPSQHGGWMVDLAMFPSEDVVIVHGGTMPGLAFELPMAKGTWSIRWNVPGGPRTSTTFTLGDQPSPAIVLKPD